MADSLLCLLVAFVLATITRCQEQMRNGDDHVECSMIVKRCQAQCSSFPENYVRWTVDVDEQTWKCELHESLPPLPEDPSNLSVYDVQCCPKKVERQAEPQTHFCDDDKVDTLIVLGVGTLLSILMMCGFAFTGLIMFHRKKIMYKAKTKKFQIRKHSSTGESRRSTASGTVTEFSPEHKGKCLKSKKREDAQKDYSAVRKHSGGLNTAAKENEEKNPAAVEHNCRLDYVNQEAHEQQNNHSTFCGVNDDATSAEKMASRVEIANNYEIHGGFVPPSSCYQEEPKYLRYPDFQPNSFSDCALKMTTSYQIPAVKSKSRDAVEDPYVQAPPLKSLRCQSKSEKPHAYQTLIPNGSEPKDESDDYNMLVHNSTVPSQDAKAFFLLNNNLKSSGMNGNNKCKVILKSHCQSQPSNKITINEMNC